MDDAEVIKVALEFEKRIWDTINEFGRRSKDTAEVMQFGCLMAGILISQAVNVCAMVEKRQLESHRLHSLMGELIERLKKEFPELLNVAKVNCMLTDPKRMN